MAKFLKLFCRSSGESGSTTDSSSANTEQVAPAELLARFLLQSDWFGSDGKVRYKAFMPHHTRLDLSVTRHRSLAIADLWRIGHAVADVTRRTLYGRADVSVQSCLSLELRVEETLLDGNPNHADVLGWPNDKPQQKSLAQQLAAASTFVPAENFDAP
ncbi:MAG: hypothetical protein JSS27_10210 [Planctomycetes bacterium]|nr:hypothetical protein [Planctomycetota bacterium]